MGALSEAFVNEKHILTPAWGWVALTRRGGGLPSPPRLTPSQAAKSRVGRPLSSLRARLGFTSSQSTLGYSLELQ